MTLFVKCTCGGVTTFGMPALSCTLTISLSNGTDAGVNGRAVCPPQTRTAKTTVQILDAIALFPFNRPYCRCRGERISDPGSSRNVRFGSIVDIQSPQLSYAGVTETRALVQAGSR